jgi:hypothetical protein
VNPTQEVQRGFFQATGALGLWLLVLVLLALFAPKSLPKPVQAQSLNAGGCGNCQRVAVGDSALSANLG